VFYFAVSVFFVCDCKNKVTKNAVSTGLNFFEIFFYAVSVCTPFLFVQSLVVTADEKPQEMALKSAIPIISLSQRRYNAKQTNKKTKKIIAGGVAGALTVGVGSYLAVLAVRKASVKNEASPKLPDSKKQTDNSKKPSAKKTAFETAASKSRNLLEKLFEPVIHSENSLKSSEELPPVIHPVIADNAYFKAVGEVNPEIVNTMHTAFLAPKQFTFSDNSHEILARDIAQILDNRFPSLKDQTSDAEVEKVLMFIKDGGLLNDLVNKNKEGNPEFYADKSLIKVKDTGSDEGDVKLTNFRIGVLYDKLERVSNKKYHDHIENRKNKP
jgi:hypothetical protein